MTFQPVVPLSGYGGWRFLNRTIEAQKETFAESGSIQRQMDYFRDNIGSIKTAEDLVNDRQLLNVALDAFGLSEDINAKAFIQKVLDDGTLDTSALSNKLSDKRYAALSKAFGFGDFDTPRTQLSYFADEVLEKFVDRSFEVAVGTVDNDMRLALNLSDALTEIADNASSNRAQWFGVMGNTAVRAVFDGALGLPDSFGSLDIDKQLETYLDRSERVFGTDTVADFSDPDLQEQLIRTYLIRASIGQIDPTTSGAVALSLLQS